MRIAMFHATLPEPGRKLGGVEVVVHRLANALAGGGGHDVLVLSAGPRPADAVYAHARLRLPGRSGTGHMARLAAVPLLLNRINLPDRQVLHLHGDDWFFVARSLPTVRTLHGSALREAQNATTLKRRGLQYGVYPLEHASARLADVTLAVGPDASRLYPRSVLVDNGVDTDRFRPGAKAEVPTVLFVGGWSSRKRGYLVQRAFEQHIRPRLPNARLIMVSDHADASPGVEHVPHASDDELARLFRSAWVFAYPSAYEGFGLPYLEAMASGTAVVATYNDGAAHVLGNGKYGRMVQDNDFPPTLLQMLLDEDARAAAERAGLERAHQLTWQRIAAKHVEYYAEAAERYAVRRARRGPRAASGSNGRA